MAAAFKIDGVQSVLTALERRAKLMGEPHPKVAVGYSTPYAVRIHEDLEMRHPHGGQAKYLEQPSREMKSELGRIAYLMLRRGMSLPQAVLAAAQALLAASQLLVPVDTGRLRASGYARLE